MGGQSNECFLRKNCQYQSCVADSFWSTTIVSGASGPSPSAPSPGGPPSNWVPPSPSGPPSNWVPTPSPGNPPHWFPPTASPVPPPASGNTWWNRNCYTEYPSGQWFGASNIGDNLGSIGSSECNSRCRSTWGCTCYVMGKAGECYLRKNCQEQSCVTDPYYYTIVIN